MAETIKDAEFEAFLAQIKSETPDMSVIKAGMEKFGMGFFSDSQKEAFLKAMFPAPIQKGASASEKLGFQDLNGIKNSLKAMQELCADEKSPVGNNEMKSFLTLTDPANGRNVLTTVALNTWAAEKKDKIIRDKGSKEFVALLDKQENAMIDIQNILNKIDARTMAEAANTADASDRFGNRPIRPVTYRELAAKSPLLMDENMKRIAPELEKMNFPVLRPKETGLVKVEDKERGLAKVEDKERGVAKASDQKTAVTVNGADNPVKVGNLNDNALDVNGTPATNPNTEDPDQKIANYEGDAGPDSKDGKNEHPSGLGTVREQDIIDYMFQNWFLGGVNLILDGAYKIADRGIDALCGNYENAPKSKVTATRGGGAAAASATPASAGRAASDGVANSTNDYAAQLNNVASQCAAQYTNIANSLIGDSAKVAAIAQCIQRHIGQEPDKWTPQFVAGEKDAPKMVFNPKDHIGLIKQLNAIYRKNPQAFKERMNILLKNPEMIRETFNPKTIGLSSQLATIKYAVKHPEKDLAGDNKAKEKIGKDAFNIMMEITATAAQIREKNEQEYRLRNNKGPNDKLDDKDLKKIQESSTQEMGAYVVGICEKGKALKDLLIKQQQEQDASQKAILAQQIKQAQKDFDDFYGQYLPKGREGERGREGEQKPATLPGPMNLTEEAQRREQTDRATEQFKSMITEGLSNLAEQQEQNHTRHQNFVMKRNEIQGNGSRSSTMQNFFSNVFGQNKGRN